jgi:chromosome segregation ATPase
MSRELNRDLFGTPANSMPRPNARSSAEVAPMATIEDLKLMSFQIDTLSKKLKEYEAKTESLASRWDEFSASSKLRFERIQGHFQRQGEAIQSSFRDVHAKVATIASRINERKMADVSIQQMVERHQQVVQSFDARLHQLQKVLSEQELQLMNSRSELKEALKELALLKRG